MFGAFYGDVIGSEYENACTKDYDFPFKRESHFTDDSVMTVAVCRAILNNGENVLEVSEPETSGIFKIAIWKRWCYL